MFSPSPKLNHWIKAITVRSNAGLRLFCFHYAGGNAFVFRNWANQVLDGVDVYAVELPGHGTRLAEPPCNRMECLIQDLKAALMPYLKPPFAFFGHSMGALISYELAQALRKEDLSPLHLFVSGYRAPHVPDDEPPIHTLPTADFLNALRCYNGTPEAILQNSELMELLLPTLRADFALLEAYQYRSRPLLDCPITAFGGAEDWKASAEEIKAWRSHTQSKFLFYRFPGDHFFVHSAQSSLLQVLNAALQDLVGV
ncbi:thioesterase II family protein [Acaryochloris marina]|uniref:Thioesterase n=1 Tax=Acaryochloris marina (strain MBIC 11017) TaxID=329726 RepID=A8ZKM3_ACAM1|nr:alpha/beta fold hydrolase [Acaryochloris marina]ABW31723.1 thioesterase [Acaryochloris marina MBIC11017]